MSWGMTQPGVIPQTRRAPSSHQPWIPEPYMERGVEHLLNRMAGGLALDPGMGKTSITLAAFLLLKSRGLARTMLVVAPLRVCRQVWRQEAQKWTQFRALTFSLLHGPKKDAALKVDADVYLINPEGVKWLSEKFFGRSLPFDIVVIDELTKFKNHQSERSKSLRPRLRGVSRRWGLTGSLMPNGFMDLFGQMLILDDGAALGKYITHYRDAYFQVDYDGFTYNLMPGAEKRIVEKIAPYWLQLSADDYLQLPPVVVDQIELELDGGSRTHYDKMKRDMIAQLPDGVVTAANAASTYSKLSQMANGAVYMTDGSVAHIHDIKLDALEELIEELNGKPLLIAYEFNHDLERLRHRFGETLPYLGKGTSAADEDRWIKAWNRNELPVLAAHPASAGHGLTLQEGSAAHVAWFGITWDLELWDQFLRRLRRKGNDAQRIFNHLLIVKNSMDELKLTALRDKDMTQGRLLKALNTEIRRDADSHSGGDTPAEDRREFTMVARLPRQDAPQPAAVSQAASATAPQVKGWGKPAAADPGAEAQQERIVSQIRPEPPAAQAETAQPRSAFSGNVRAAMQAIEGGEAPGSAIEGDQGPVPVKEPGPRRRAPKDKLEPATPFDVSHELKVQILAMAFSDPATTLEDGLEIAKDMLAWVRES